MTVTGHLLFNQQIKTTTMAKQVYYHGTSIENLEYIKKYGFSPLESKIWTVSLEEVYLWSVDGVSEANCIEAEPDEYKEAETMRIAFDSARTAICVSEGAKCVVFRLELDPVKYDVCEDQSCENMAGNGAVATEKTIPFSCVTDYYVSDDLTELKPYILSTLLSNDYFEVGNFSIPPVRLAMAEVFQKGPNDGLFEYVYELELQKTYSKKKTLQVN